MDQAAINELIAAGITLAVALMGYLAVYVRARTNAIEQHLALIGRQTQPRTRQAAGGGLYPVWNQLADVAAGPGLPAGRYEECGEECCAMVIAEQHGVQVPADYLRVLLGGSGRSPLTTAADLVRLLDGQNVAATRQQIEANAVDGVLQRITAAGGCAIALGTFVAPGVLHWILVTRADTQGCGANDPWLGRRRTFTWAEFRPPYASDLVVITRPPDAR